MLRPEVAGMTDGQPGLGARVARDAGFAIMVVETVVAVFFLVGETFADPGGWAAVGLVLAWAVPLGGLCALVRLRPDGATRVLTALTGLLVVADVWSVLAPGAWRGLEDQYGPVRTVATFVLAAALALLGLGRTRVAGALLVVVGGVPWVLSVLGGRGVFGSLAVVSLPPLLAGLLYLLSAGLARRPRSGRLIDTRACSSLSGRLPARTRIWVPSGR